MTNTYRATTPAAVAAYGEGVIELDLSVTDEADAVKAGRLELVPRPYRVMVDNYTHGGVATAPGDVISAALPVELEAALVSGGVLERTRKDAHPTVDETEAEAKPRRSRKTATEADEPKE